MHHARAADPRGRDADRRRHAAACDRQPRPAVLAEYRLKQSELELERQKLQAPATKPADDARRHADRAATPTSSCRRTCAQALENGADGRRPVPHRVPVPQPRGLPAEDEQFEAYRAVAEGDEGPAGHDPHARPRRRQGARQRLDGCARRAQPGAGPARDPLLPGRAAAVPHAAARDPARVALRQGAHPDADARVARTRSTRRSR